MFEGMKRKAWVEGREFSMSQAKIEAESCHVTDANGITYATNGDYMKAKVAFNAKDTEIASLKEELKDAKKVQAGLSECNKELEQFCIKAIGNAQSALEADLAKCRKELEQFYLKAIGDCKTVKQVEAVLKRYHESESFKAWVLGVMKETFMVGLFSGKQITPKGSQVDQASATKIKRINTKDAIEVCNALDDFEDDDFYAGLMAKTLKEIAGIEVDMTKVLAAKDSGLAAWNVLLSMLSAYGVKHDSVLEVK